MFRPFDYHSLQHVTILFFFSTSLIKDVTGYSNEWNTECLQPISRLPCNILHTVIGKEGLFSFSKETLDNDCPKLLDSFRCLKDHWTKCKPFSVDKLVLYISGLKSIMEEMCDSNSDLRKEYTKYMPCLTASSDSLRNCTHIAEEKVTSQIVKNYQVYLLSVNTYRCLAHIELSVCIRDIAKSNCGEEAGQLMGRLVERSIRPYRQANCYLPEHLNQPSRKEEYKRLLF